VPPADVRGWVPLVVGAAALLIMWPVLWWAWLALFTSVFGLMLAGVIVHGVGTAVAMVLDLPQAARTLRLVSWRVGVAAACALFLWFAVPTTYKAVISLSLPLYREYPGSEAIVSALFAYVLCAVLARRVEPAWPRLGSPLALVAVVVTTIVVFVLTSRAAPSSGAFPPGGPNMAEPPPGPWR
jgi:hypothetical protein